MVRVLSFVGLLTVAIAAGASAQSPDATTHTSFPRVIRIGGVLPQPAGAPSSTAAVTFAIYADQTGGTPLWQETHTVPVDRGGAYTALLGSSVPDGLPLEIFSANEARWLSIHVEGATDHDQPRVLIASVAYALRAADADTLGGKPASAYVLAASPTDAPHGDHESTPDAARQSTRASTSTVGTPGRLGLFVDAANLGDSVVAQSGARIGVGTSSPADYLHIAFNDPFGAFTGLAVQNLSGNANAASGMLFYDHNGALTQFQGFNNANHAYVINNIAKNGSSQFDGSYNFLIGSASKLFVATNGNIGMGTNAPAINLEVTNASGSSTTTIGATAYSNGFFPPVFSGRKARGTQAAPTAAQSGDTLAMLAGRGYGTTGFSGPANGAVVINAAETFTDTAHGTSMNFTTTPIGTTQAKVAMLIDPNGNIGIGPNTPSGSNVLDIVRNGSDAQVSITSFSGEANLFLSSGRGTSAAPTGVQAADVLGSIGFGGIDSTTAGGLASIMGSVAVESWTGASHGSAFGIFTTPIGSTTPQVNFAVRDSGFVAIGTGVDANGVPTAADRLQVFGDIRVGTSGSNGCLKNFAGTGIAGTCASDLRFKKDIAPFAPALASLTALQPVHYSWRTAEFPDRHFGTSRAYGLIAQDVEKVLPELVATDAEGYKAVDYAKLPLLTIQAVKELKSENDALKSRLAELELLVKELLAGTPR